MTAKEHIEELQREFLHQFSYEYKHLKERNQKLRL